MGWYGMVCYNSNSLCVLLPINQSSIYLWLNLVDTYTSDQICLTYIFSWGRVFFLPHQESGAMTFGMAGEHATMPMGMCILDTLKTA